MAKELKLRSQVEEQYTWDLTALFKTEEELETTLNKVIESSKVIEQKYRGKLNSPEMINACLDELKGVMQDVNLVSTFSDLSVAGDQTNVANLGRQTRVSNSLSDVNSRLSFIESEIIEANDEVITSAIEASGDNAHYLKNIIRNKEHALHPEVERVLSALSSTLNAPHQLYNRAKLADMDFGTFKVNGKEYPLSFTLFEAEWEFEDDTNIRRAAFKAFSNKLREYENTIAGTYQTQVQKEKTLATLRGFDSVIDSLLFRQKVDRVLYDRQIDLIMEHLAPHMRKYATLLKEIHGLDELTFDDLRITVDPEFEPDISVEESKKYIKEALGVLGDDYLEMLHRAYDERWIDFVQNKGKSTGAFCTSPYGSHPFILISWTGKMRGVFVLAHELGHAGHFYLAHQNQNIYDARPSLYFIEAPSTMNEMLMANYLLKNSDDPRMKRWILWSIINRTYYHNFVTHLLEAHYQREVYRIIDAGGSVQAATLNELKRATLEKFWGETVTINEGAELTWMRQPHYYRGLYPYTYSAGLTVATEVSKRVLEEGQPAIDDWRKVLKAGGTRTPVELAQMAGVDITTDEPLLNTISYVGDIIDQIVELTEKLNKS